MTCREKLKIEHPEKIGEQYYGGCDGCPPTYGYLDPPDICAKDIEPSEEVCTACWDREIPEENLCKCYDEQCQCCNGTRERDACFCGGHELKCDFYPEKREKAKNATEVKPHILDSGTRRQFESGAVRDIQEGKGRCDLLPLDVVGHCLSNPTLAYISYFQQSGNVDALYDALSASGVYHDPYTMILEVSKHFEEGAKKYGEHNWQKGIPTHCYIDSAVRHYLKWLRGDKDEPHDRAFVWNILCCIWTCKHKPELNDYAKKEATNESNN